MLLLLLCVTVVTLMGEVLGLPQKMELQYSITEGIPSGSFVGNVREDIKRNADFVSKYSPADIDRMTFQFLTNPAVPLKIEAGVISTKDAIDRDALCPQEDTCQDEFDIIASLPGGSIQFIKVVITIEDTNDNAPAFAESRLILEISESASLRTSLLLPNAEDDDSPRYGIQGYDLDTRTDTFSLEVEEQFDGSEDVKLILTKELDRETQDEYVIKVVAYDGGVPRKTGSIEVVIKVLDANDNDPKFDQSSYEVRVEEDVPPGSSILQVHASDADLGRNGAVRYSLSPRSQAALGKLFRVDPVTGTIITRDTLDYETSQVYHLTVTAQDEGVDSAAVAVVVVIRLQDVNDHAPTITVNTLKTPDTDEAVVSEHAPVGTFVAHVRVADKDAGKNGKFNCSLSDDKFNLTQMYATEYQITTSAILDREARAAYSLALVCKDGGAEPRTGIKNLVVKVADVNDNTPRFSQSRYEATLIENNYEGKRIVQVNASDLDTGENAELVYSLADDVSGMFNIDEKTGVISAAVSIDRETTPEVRFSVYAHDLGDPQRSGSALVHVTVQDVNDARPVFSQQSYSFGLFENEPAGTEAGVVAATDADLPPNNEVTYSILPSRSDTDSFSVHPATGKIVTTRPLDRETATVYYLVIAAEDSGSPALTATVSASVYVADKNDNDPEFLFPSRANNSVYVSNQVPIGYAVTRVRATDADIGNSARLSFHITGGNRGGVFSIDPSNGVITTNVDLRDDDNQGFEVVVRARDHGDPPHFTDAALNIFVNKSVPFPAAHNALLSGQNFTIVISLACASGIITVVLVIAIVCIRRQDRHKGTHKYNCRAAEALKILSQPPQPNGSHGNGDVPRKEVSFSLEPAPPPRSYSLEPAAGTRPDSQQSWPSAIEPAYTPTPQAHSSLTHDVTASPPLAGARHYHTAPGRGPATAPRGASSLPRGVGAPHGQTRSPRAPAPPPSGAQPWQLTQKELEVHQLLELLKRDGAGGGGDTDSAYSGDNGSQTDSGRGASEADNTAANGGDASGAAGPPPSHHIVAIPGTIREESPLPGSRKTTSPNGTNTTSSFHPTPVSYRTPDRTNPFRQMIEDAYGPLPDRGSSPRLERRQQAASKTAAHGDGDVMDKAFIEPPPRGVTFGKHNTPAGARKDDKENRFYGYHSYMGDSTLAGNDSTVERSTAIDDSTVNTTAPGMQYSCVDVSEGLKTPKNKNNMSMDDDDDNTTLSGSYVVDANDLCNEIDDLFFKDMVV